MVGKGSNGIADDMGWWREGGRGTCGVKWLVWERLQGIDGEETEGEEEGIVIFKEVALCADARCWDVGMGGWDIARESVHVV